MKNICYMSGAVINAGDFLIEKRAIELLKQFIPDANITIHNRVGTDYSDRLDYLNSFDGILFAGGPIYSLNIYPSAIPFVNELEKVSPPIFFMGGGLWSSIYDSKLSEQSKAFFTLGCKRGMQLGCRDWYTYRFLKHQGFQYLIMTGCPAWYDLNFIENTKICSSSDIQKICISEPANAKNIDLLYFLLKWLRNNYKKASIILVIHREKKAQINDNIKKWENEIGISVIYISNSSEGFQVYDDCQLHIGFRVHAHIYNLSRRNFSILINEDIRGNGINHALGLENININSLTDTIRQKRIIKNFYITQKNEKKISYSSIINQIEDIIEYSYLVNFKNYRDAFQNMYNYFDSMKKHIQMINDSL